MDSTVMPKTTEADDALAARADERLAHAYEQIALADEQLARLTEQMTRMEKQPARQPSAVLRQRPSRGGPATSRLAFVIRCRLRKFSGGLPGTSRLPYRRSTGSRRCSTLAVWQARSETYPDS